MKEILIYGIAFIFVVYITIGLVGGYDTDKDNPWKNKQSGGVMVTLGEVVAETLRLTQTGITGSNPVLIAMSKRYSVRLATFCKKVVVVKSPRP